MAYHKGKMIFDIQVEDKVMYCQKKIAHTIQEGDSLYKLSKQYDTTVTELILGNPGSNPYNLQIGKVLYVCPGERYMAEMQPEQPGTGMPEPGEPEENPAQTQDAVQLLKDEMRIAWLNQIYWIRMYLMSVDAGAGDQRSIEERMLETADEINDVFADHLPVAVTRQLRELLMEHVELAADMIQTLKSDEQENYDEKIRAWYENANQIASLLARQNAYFDNRKTRNMLLNHLDLTRQSMEQQTAGRFGQSIDTFRDLESQTRAMADYLSTGLLAR